MNLRRDTFDDSIRGDTYNRLQEMNRPDPLFVVLLLRLSYPKRLGIIVSDIHCASDEKNQLFALACLWSQNNLRVDGMKHQIRQVWINERQLTSTVDQFRRDANRGQGL